MKLTRKVLQPGNDDRSFIFTCGHGGARVEIAGCWLELYYTLEEDEYWVYAGQFPTGRNRETVKDDLRLTFLGGQWQVRVAIRPKDANARYGTGDVTMVVEHVERDFGRFLQPKSR